jgi:1-hydroxycarotenoid 3,4-desaturase
MPSLSTLSAVTWAMQARCSGLALAHHNVFFSRDYAHEFNQIFRDGRLPDAPTVYLCAQDRDDTDTPMPSAPQRLLMLVNAPPQGDTHQFSAQEIETCAQAAFALLERCGLRVERNSTNAVVTHPGDFHRLFPATGGALYGRASHGWRAAFQRPGARTKLPGLYVAGGSTHPGPGVPMAALSGQLAAAACLEDARRARHATSPLPLTRK